MDCQCKSSEFGVGQRWPHWLETTPSANSHTWTKRSEKVRIHRRLWPGKWSQVLWWIWTLDDWLPQPEEEVGGEQTGWRKASGGGSHGVHRVVKTTSGNQDQDQDQDFIYHRKIPTKKVKFTSKWNIKTSFQQSILWQCRKMWKKIINYFEALSKKENPKNTLWFLKLTLTLLSNEPVIRRLHHSGCHRV